jgi:hypothetical protein
MLTGVAEILGAAFAFGAAEGVGLNNPVNLSTASLVPAPKAAPVNALVTALTAELVLVLAGVTVGFLTPEAAVVLVGVLAGVVTVLVTFGAVEVPVAGVLVAEVPAVDDPVAGTLGAVVVDGLGETTDGDVVEVIGALTPDPIVGDVDS